jgi:Flp pilus assembly protein TadG
MVSTEDTRTEIDERVGMRRFQRIKEEGQTIVVVALSLIALIAFVGLATDVVLLYVAQHHLQRAIDAAALAAANKLPDDDEAERAAYEFTRLNGYTFDLLNEPLDITFPTYNPPRKVAAVTGTVEVDLAFLKVVGWDTAEVMAAGVGESAPLDVYLVLDLSHSMVYDGSRPGWWNTNATRYDVCPGTGCPEDECELVDDYDSWYQCRAFYCNFEGDLKRRDGSVFLADKVADCDPLDAHIKDSAMYFIDQLDARYDRVGVIGYDIQGTLAIPLTSDFDAVKTTIRSLNAYLHPIQQLSDSGNFYSDFYHLCTNIGDGLMVANAKMSLPSPEIGGEGGRTDSIWSIVLLTDGRANRYRDCDSCPSQYCSPWTGYCPRANNWATDKAWDSWDPYRITTYTIAYGDIFFDQPVYRQLMIDIADITDNGTVDGDTENFWAVPDEAGLRQAFEEIAERIYTRLLR